MKVGIVGVGKIGSLYASFLRNAGHATLLVDPRAEAAKYRALSELEVRTFSQIDAWIIASPTATHFSILQQILARNGRARVLIEKPVCAPSELHALDALRRSYVDARIMVSDVYGHSPAVLALAKSRRKMSTHLAVRKITVELTKNRVADSTSGRFVDFQYGDLGYEWFHLLSILRALLSPAEYSEYLANQLSRSCLSPEIRERTSIPGLPEIELYSSVRGRIGLPELGASGFEHPEIRAELESRHIARGSELRYRFADVELEGNVHATLIFEPGFGFGGDFKNRHNLVIRAGRHVEKKSIVGNQLSHALFSQLSQLCRRGGASFDLHLAEHRRMFEIKSALSARGESTTRFTREAAHV